MTEPVKEVLFPWGMNIQGVKLSKDGRIMIKTSHELAWFDADTCAKQNIKYWLKRGGEEYKP